jgi:hypothetical protein
MSIMKLTALAPKSVSTSVRHVSTLGGRWWNREGTYHMSARPSREVTHQQVGSQSHLQLKGLWIFSRSVVASSRS